MASLRYGLHKEGPRQPMLLPVKASAAIVANYAVTMDASGYVDAVNASSDKVYGFAMGTVTGGSADGDVSVLVDVSEQTVYRLPPDTGTVTQALLWLTMDIGADGQSVNIDSSGTDTIYVVGVDTVANELYVQLRAAPAGVV